MLKQLKWKVNWTVSHIYALATRSLDVLTGLLDQLEEEEEAAEALEQGFAEDDE